MDFNLIFQILSVIVIPFTVWLFNIQKEHYKEMQILKEILADKVPFKRYDELKEYLDQKFVRIDTYMTSNLYQEKVSDEKFKAIIKTMETEFRNLETKLDDLKGSINKR